MKKLVSLLLMIVGLFAFTGCPAMEPTLKATVQTTETAVAITVVDEEGDPTLLMAMEILQEEGKLTFTKDATGMITSINGKENAADWSASWMLYTSDDELSNTEWGTIEWNGKTYGSAVVGASSLQVDEEETYVWVYQPVAQPGS